MDRVCTTNRCLTCFGESEESDFTCLLQVHHGADCVLDRHGRIDAVLVIHVDGIDAEPLQRSVTGASNVLRRSVDAEPRAILAAHVAEFRRDHSVTAAIANGPAYET